MGNSELIFSRSSKGLKGAMPLNSARGGYLPVWPGRSDLKAFPFTADMLHAMRLDIVSLWGAGAMQHIHISEIKRILLEHFFSPMKSAQELVGRFTAIQIDPTSIVSTNQKLVFAARSSGTLHKDLEKLYKSTSIIETYAKERSIILREDAPLIWPLLIERKKKKEEIFITFRRELEYIRSYLQEHEVISAGKLDLGSVEAKDIWGTKKCATMLLGLLWETGEIIVASRDNRSVVYKTSSPDIWFDRKLDSLSEEDVRLFRWKRYLDGVAITDSRDTFAGFERSTASDRVLMLNRLIEANYAIPVSGVGKSLCVISRQVLEKSFSKIECFLPRFIPPLDNFIWHRAMIKDIWNFDYRWEIYTPAALRKFGPYAMPLVTSSGLFGPVDFRYDRAAGRLSGDLSKSIDIERSPSALNAAQTAARALGKALGAKEVELK